MAKRKKSHGFLLGMILYAVVFLVLTAVGLKFFWGYMEGYEQSRPRNTADAYVKALTVEKMVSKAEPWFSRLDHTLQSGEACMEIIRDALGEAVSYAKMAGECTDTRQVYVLRCGKQVIGRMAMEAEAADKYGFSRWNVTEESFDFSYLEGEPVRVTVPETYRVSLNGQALDERYITESGIHYPLLEEFYGQYELPTLVTYQADNFLGQLTLEVVDSTGKAVSVDENTDVNTLLGNCTDAERTELKSLTEGFLQKYVQFCGSANKSVTRNYYQMKEYLVPEGELARRLLSAFDGLSYAQSHGDGINTVEIHHFIRLDAERYLCDATYVVDTWGQKGLVQTTNNMKIIALQTKNGLRVEAITSY